MRSAPSGASSKSRSARASCSSVSERREFQVLDDDEPGVVVSIAPGLGQPRPQRRGEARGLHVYEADEAQLRATTYVWRDDGWGLTAMRTFARGRDPLALEPR